MSQFAQGQSGNPGGRPKGLERYAREQVGDNGQRLVDFWLSVMDDPGAGTAYKLKASELLAQRAFGRPPQQVELTGDDGGPIQHEHAARLTLNDVLALRDSLAANGSD